MIVMLPLLLLVGEVTPKTIAVTSPRKIRHRNRGRSAPALGSVHRSAAMGRAECLETE